MKKIVVLFILIFALAMVCALAQADEDTLILPRDTVTIEAYAFYGTNAKKIYLPAGVTTIGDYAFGGSDSLLEVHVPDELMNREEDALKGSANARFVNLSASQFQYTVSSDGVTIKKYTGNQAKVSIPAKIEGKPVTVIDEGAFKANSALTKIIIPEGVTEIKKEAFQNCSNLTDVTFPSSLTKLGDNAFSGCGNSSQIPYYFYLPDNLSEIGRLISNNQMAFHECNAIKIVSFNSLTARMLSEKGEGYVYGRFTFAGENDFRYIYMKQDNQVTDTLVLVEYTGTNTEVRIPDHGTNATRTKIIWDGTFADKQNITKVIIPEGVTEVRKNAFCRCYSLTNVTFPSSLSILGNNAFTECGKNAADVFYWHLPDNLTALGRMNSETEYAFGYCNAVKVVTRGSNTAKLLSSMKNSLGWFTFDGEYDYRYLYGQRDNEYDQLIVTKFVGSGTMADIAGDVEIIGDSAFAENQTIRKVIIPEGVTVIQNRAFYNCNNLTDITFPSTLEYILNYAFNYCGTASEIAYYFDLPDSMTEIASLNPDAFRNCNARICCNKYTQNGQETSTYRLLGERWWGWPSGHFRLTYEGSGENTQTVLGGYVAPVGEAGTVKVTVPDGVNIIDEDAFKGRTDLSEVVMPNSVSQIRARAFMNCTNLNTITFSSNLRWIGENSFTGCGHGEYSFLLPYAIQTVAPHVNAEPGIQTTGSFDGCEATLQTKNGFGFPTQDENTTPVTMQLAGYSCTIVQD